MCFSLLCCCSVKCAPRCIHKKQISLQNCQNIPHCQWIDVVWYSNTAIGSKGCVLTILKWNHFTCTYSGFHSNSPYDWRTLESAKRKKSKPNGRVEEERKKNDCENSMRRKWQNVLFRPVRPLSVWVRAPLLIWIMSFCTVSVFRERRFFRKLIDKNTHNFGRRLSACLPACLSPALRLPGQLYAYAILEMTIRRRCQVFCIFKIRNYNSLTQLGFFIELVMKWAAAPHIEICKNDFSVFISVFCIRLVNVTFPTKRFFDALKHFAFITVHWPLAMNKPQISTHSFPIQFVISFGNARDDLLSKIMTNVLFIPKYVNIIDRRTYYMRHIRYIV